MFRMYVRKVLNVQRKRNKLLFECKENVFLFGIRLKFDYICRKSYEEKHENRSNSIGKWERSVQLLFHRGFLEQSKEGD